MLKELDTIEKALTRKLISLQEAQEFVDVLEFEHRRQDILEWGKHYFPDKFSLPFCEELHRYLISIRNLPYTDTLAPRGHAKCIDPNTIIFGTFGTKKIKDVCIGDQIYSVDEELKLKQQCVLAVSGKQYKKGYLIKTRTGKTIKISDGHRMLTFKGYQVSEKIKTGDYIASLNAKVESDYEINVDEMLFIAYMIFEGNTKNRRISLGSEILINEFDSICKNLGFNLKKIKGANVDYGISAKGSRRVRLILEKYNIYGKLSYNKRLPVDFFKMSYKQKMLFISVMIDTDGYVSQQACQIGITLANEKLIDDIQLLLSSCKIISSKIKRKNKKAGAWSLSINAKYASQIIKDGNVLLKKQRIKNLTLKKSYSLFDIYPNEIKKNVINIERLARAKKIRVDNRYEITREKLKRLSEEFPSCKEFKKQLNQDVFWDKVVSVERINKIEEYFDIQVSGNENFIANGLISHNTTIKCFLIPIFQALNEPQAFRHYLNIQATMSKAVTANLAIRDEIETNEKLLKDYGNLCSDEKWTEKQFVLSNGVIFTALGAGQSVRGINYKNIRPDYVIADDLYDEDDINNPESVQKIERWWWGSIFKCVAVGKTTSMHLQGTAISKNDLMHAQSNKERWKFRKFQAIKDAESKDVLWPEMNSYESLMKDKEDMGSIIFNREMQNEPRDDETSIIKEPWIRYYDGVLPEDDEEIEVILLGVDPSSGEKAHLDPTGIALCLLTSKGNFYFHELINEHLTVDKRKERCERFGERYSLNEARIEAVAGFKDFAIMMQKETRLPVVQWPAVKDKITRLENVSVHFENGKVYFNRQIEKKVLNEAIEQLLNNKPKHDDVRDAIVICLEERKNRGMTIY